MSITCPKCRSDNPGTLKFCGDCGTPLPSSQSMRPEFTETMQTPIKELTTGSTFAGRYQIIEELGHGGMGRVYKVYDTEIKEKIALKLLKPEVGNDPETIERFRNELKFARQIGHRNVCKMFDLNKEEGTYYLTMEYVHGEDLKRLIRKMGFIPAGKTVSIARQLCQGLAEAHRLGIVHRDLKPQNIMVDEGGNAKIMDFGIARSLSAKGVTGAGVMIGTPEYMSPEQVEGKETDPRSDIYSLGVILFEMATGRVPFEGDTPFTVGVKHKSEAPANPRDLNAHVPDDLSRLILRCLAKDKEKRYQTTDEIIADLDKIERGLPTTERLVPERKTVSSREFTVKFTPRKLILPAAVVLAVIVAAIFFWPKKASNLDPNLVAVAVFENKTGDPKLDPVGSMAAERIMQGLSQVGQFTVAPMASPEALAAASKGKDKLRALADFTKAGKIVHGDYYVQGDTIQFHAWVQDMAAKKDIVSLEPASGPAQDPAAAFEPLRLRLMGGLAAIFNPRLEPYLKFGFRPTTFEALKEHLDGAGLFFRRSYKDSIGHFLRAAESDPKFFLPLFYAAMANINLRQYATADELGQKMEILRPELSAFERASLDWLQAAARGDHETTMRIARQQAALYKDYNWTFGLALNGLEANYPQEALAALTRLDPNDPNYRDWSPYWTNLALAHHALGNYNQELKVARSARKLFPNLISIEVRPNAALGRMGDLEKLFEECKNLSSTTLGSVMMSAGRELRAHGFKEESVRILERARQWFESRPDQEKVSSQNRSNLALTYYVLGKWAEAKDLYEELRKASPNSITYLGQLGMTAARMGDRESALKISKELEEEKRLYLFGSPTAYRAEIAALLGDKEGAVNLLRKATGEGYSFRNLYLDEDLESLADYPPFIQFMKPKG